MEEQAVLEPVKRGRGRPKGSKNKPKVQLEPVVGKPRADFHCEKCQEMYVLPISATVCPDSECGGSIARIWAGSPPGVKSAATALVDKVVGAEVDNAKQKLNYRPEFKTTRASVGAAMGMVDGPGKAFSRNGNMPLIQSLGGGPSPIWAR